VLLLSPIQTSDRRFYRDLLPDNTQHSQGTEIHSPLRDSNPQFQQAGGHRRRPYTGRPLGSAMGLIYKETNKMADEAYSSVNPGTFVMSHRTCVNTWICIQGAWIECGCRRGVTCYDLLDHSNFSPYISNFEFDVCLSVHRCLSVEKVFLLYAFYGLIYISIYRHHCICLILRFGPGDHYNLCLKGSSLFVWVALQISVIIQPRCLRAACYLSDSLFWSR